MTDATDTDQAIKSLDERMVAAGMIPLSTILSGEGVLKQWMAHTGVVDLDTFEQWLLMRYRELLIMRMPYELGDKDKSDELYEWVLGHAGAFSEVTANFRAMKERSPAAAVRKMIQPKALTWSTDPWGKPLAVTPVGTSYGLERERDDSEKWVILFNGTYLHAPVHGFIRSFEIDAAKAFVEAHYRDHLAGAFQLEEAAVPAENLLETARSALDDSNSLLAAMLHEQRPQDEIEIQIVENRNAITKIEASPAAQNDPPDTRIDRAIKALRPFSDAVFNDNGDMTVDRSFPEYEDFVEAYRAHRVLTRG